MERGETDREQTEPDRSGRERSEPERSGSQTDREGTEATCSVIASLKGD